MPPGIWMFVKFRSLWQVYCILLWLNRSCSLCLNYIQLCHISGQNHNCLPPHPPPAGTKSVDAPADYICDVFKCIQVFSLILLFRNLVYELSSILIITKQNV